MKYKTKYRNTGKGREMEPDVILCSAEESVNIIRASRLLDLYQMVIKQKDKQ